MLFLNFFLIFSILKNDYIKELTVEIYYSESNLIYQFSLTYTHMYMCIYVKFYRILC